MEESKTKKSFDEDINKSLNQAPRIARSESSINFDESAIENRRSTLLKIAEWLNQDPKSEIKNVVVLKKDFETPNLDEKKLRLTVLSSDESLFSAIETDESYDSQKKEKNLRDAGLVSNYEESDTKQFTSAKDTVKKGPKTHLLHKYRSNEIPDAKGVHKGEMMYSFSFDSDLEHQGSSEKTLRSSSDSTYVKPALKSPSKSSLKTHELVKHMFQLPVYKPVPKDSLEILSKRMSRKKDPPNQSDSDRSSESVSSEEKVSEDMESSALSKKVADSVFEVLKSKNVGESSGTKDKLVKRQDEKNKMLGSDRSEGSGNVQFLEAVSDSGWESNEDVVEKPTPMKHRDPKKNLPERSHGRYTKDKETSREHRQSKTYLEAHHDSESHDPAECAACNASNRRETKGFQSKSSSESSSSSTELPEIYQNVFSDKANIKQRQLKNRERKAYLPKKHGSAESSLSKEIKFQNLPNALKFDKREGKEDDNSSDGEISDESERRRISFSKNVTKTVRGNEDERSVSDTLIGTSKKQEKTRKKNTQAFYKRNLDSFKNDIKKSVEIDPVSEEIDITSPETKKNFKTKEHPSIFKSVYEKPPVLDEPRPKSEETPLIKKIATDSLEVMKAQSDRKREVVISNEDASIIPDSTSARTLQFFPEAVTMLEELKSLMDDLKRNLPNLRHDCRCSSSQELDSGPQDVPTESEYIHEKYPISHLKKNEPEQSRRQYIRSTSPNIESITIDTKKYNAGSKNEIPVKSTQIYPKTTRPPPMKHIPMISATLKDTLSIPGVQSISAITLLGNSRVQTIYHFGDSDTELIEVFVDDELRAKIVKDPTQDTYCNIQQHGDFAPGSNVNASTVIVANGCQMTTTVSRVGCKETIAVYKNGTLLCKTGNSVFEEI